MSMRLNAVASAGARDWINRNSGVVAVALCVAAGVAVGVSVWPPGCPGLPQPPAEAFYYVPATQELFVASSDLIPPIDRNGDEAVKAHFYGCGDCEGANRFLGYYEKYSVAAKAKMQIILTRLAEGQTLEGQLEKEAYALVMTQRFFSADGIHWVLAESPQGQAMQEKLREHCGSAKLVYCSP